MYHKFEHYNSLVNTIINIILTICAFVFVFTTLLICVIWHAFYNAIKFFITTIKKVTRK